MLSDHTPASIAALEAGPELDALTAEAIGMTKTHNPDDSYGGFYTIDGLHSFKPSTDPAAAWFVMERGNATLGQLWNCKEDWGASVWGENVCYARTAHRDPRVAVCRAVCLAAMAHMTDEPEKESPNGEA